MRFHLDEHVSHDVARGLRSRGVDVSTAAEADLLGAGDPAHIAFAIRESRVIVTHDADFLAFAQTGAKHSGIACCAPGSRTTGYLVRFLCLMDECLRDDEMRDRVEFM